MLFFLAYSRIFWIFLGRTIHSARGQHFTVGDRKKAPYLSSARSENPQAWLVFLGIFLCLPRAERNQRFLFVKNESIKFCCSGGFSNVPDVMEASVLFISTVFHVRSVSCRCLYLGFCAPCAARLRVLRVLSVRF